MFSKMMLDDQEDRSKKVKLARFLYDIKAISYSTYCDAVNLVNLKSIMRTLKK